MAAGAAGRAAATGDAGSSEAANTAMRMTTRGRYAVTAVLDVALHGGEGPVSLAAIAERQDISQPYLEQLFSRLRRAGLVASVRGPGGGYRLCRELDDISVADVLGAVGEGVDATRCGGSGDCQEGEVCLTHELWSDLTVQIHLFLSRITLGSLVRRGDVQSVARRQDAVHRGDLSRLIAAQRI